jgi:hypothetical protein
MAHTFVRTLRALAVLPLVALAACDLTGSDRTVQVVTDQDVYTPTAQGTATIRNLSDEELHFSFCPYEIQKRDGDRWVTVHRVPDPPICSAALHTLDPGGEASFTFTLPGNAALGRARVYLPVIRHTDGRAVSDGQKASASFRVEGFTAQ